MSTMLDGGNRIMSQANNFISPSVASDPQREQELQQVRDALRGLKFGAVNIIVQDGVVVQIDRTEKRRLRKPNSATETAFVGQ